MSGYLRKLWPFRKTPSGNEADKPKVAKIPKKVLWSVLAALFPSAFAITVLFPYLPWMVKTFTVNGERLTDTTSGTYVGLIASSLFAGRTVGSYFWGWLSDVRGRRPAMILSLGLLSISVLMFGFTNGTLGLGWAMGTRFFCGLVNGIVGTSKAILSEVCDNSNQSQAMTLLTASWGLGLILGPAIGGVLAEPVRQYPDVFGGNTFLTQFPYMLPSLVNLLFCFIGFVVIVKYLPETLQSKKKYAKLQTEGGDDGDEQEDGLRITYSAATGTNAARVTFPKPSSSTSAGAVGVKRNASEDSFSIHINHGATELYSGNDSDADALLARNAASPVHANGTASRTLPPDQLGDSELQAVDLDSSELQAVDVDDNDNRRHRMDGSLAVETSNPSISDEVPSLMMQTSWPCWSWLLRYRVFRRLHHSKLMFLFRRAITRNVILLYSVYSFGVIGTDELYSLWCSTPYYLGGLSLGLQTIGTSLAIVGGIQLPFQVLLVPKIEQRFGAKRTFALLSFPVIFGEVIMPSLTSLAGSSALLPVLVLTQLVIKCCTGGSFVCLMLMINNSVEAKDLGSTNGLAMACTGFLRSFAPVICGSIFGASISSDHPPFPFDYHLVFIFIGFIFLLTTCSSTRLPDSIDKKLGTPRK